MASPAALRLMALSALLLLCAPTTLASVTSGELVTSINRVTGKGQALQAPANSITIVNGPLIIIGQGPFPQIIDGFTQIVTDLSSSIVAAEGSDAISGSGAKDVENAVRDLVHVHQDLLNILTRKAGLFTTLPFIGQPVVAALRSYEDVMDTFLFIVSDLVPGDAAKSIANQQDSLGATIDNAIKAYSELTPSFWQ